MDFPQKSKDPGSWQVEEDPTDHADETGPGAGSASSVGADTGEGENPYGSTTGATANRHSAGPSGMGQSSGAGGDVLRDTGTDASGTPVSDADFGVRPGMPSGEGSDFTTSDPGMADEPAEGGESEVDQ